MRITLFSPITIAATNGAETRQTAFVQHNSIRVAVSIVSRYGAIQQVVVGQESDEEFFGRYTVIALLRALQLVGYTGRDAEHEAQETAKWLEHSA